MSGSPLGPAWLAGLALAASCGGGGEDGVTPPPGAANCSAPATVQLAVGQHQVLNPTAGNGCIRIPAAGGAEAEYVFALVSGSGTVTDAGVSGGYSVRVGPQGSVGQSPGAAAQVAVFPQTGAGPAERFHRALREQERQLAADPRNRLSLPASPPAGTPPPEVGSERKFAVCRTTQCNTFDTVTAIARSVGTKIAVYMDNAVPTADSLTQADMDDLKRLFDLYHYPIDNNAFGGESDLDNNGVIIVLLTDAVNALTPDCSQGRILGYFFGGDLLNITGSNHAEVFYAMVPVPATATCTAATRAQTLVRLKPTLIHEFQHMISFNQHVLLRGANVEETWLNEGLSHFAEELGGRLIPDADCVGSPSCRSQYVSGDLINAYDFMENTEAHFMVGPDNSTGTLEERGAVWLFTSWLTDQFGTDANGTNVTRGLVQTNRQGSTNVAAVAGVAFSTLVPEWMLAVYLDDLPGFTPQNERLTFGEWGLRSVFEANCCTPTSPFAQAFPFSPVNTTGSSSFQRTGTLRGGSGRHFRATQAAGSGALDVLISRTPGGPVLDAALEPRVGIVRIR